MFLRFDIVSQVLISIFGFLLVPLAGYLCLKWDTNNSAMAKTKSINYKLSLGSHN